MQTLESSNSIFHIQVKRKKTDKTIKGKNNDWKWLAGNTTMDLQVMNMNVEEISNWLHIPPATIYSFCRRGEIPCTKIGRQWRFERGHIESWLIQKTLEICIPGKLNNARQE